MKLTDECSKFLENPLSSLNKIMSKDRWTGIEILVLHGYTEKLRDIQ